MAKWTELEDTPDSFEGQKGKLPVVKEDETGLELKPIDELAGTVDLSEPRYDIDDLADDDIRDLKDEEVQKVLYRLTEKLKLIIRQHDHVLFGDDLDFGIVGPIGPEGLRGPIGPPGSPGANGEDGADGLDAPQIVFVDGVPSLEDTTRGNKVLSLSRPVFAAGHYGNAAVNMYLKSERMIPTMGSSGHLLPRPATITGIWGKSKSTASWTFEVRKNGVSSVEESVTITSGKGSKTALNIDLSADDCLQFYMNGAADFPQAWIEIAWREP